MPNKLTKEIFIYRSNIIHNNKYNYSKVKYINSKTKIIIICSKHGEFEQKPSDHLQKHGCSSCYGNTKLTKEIFIDRANIIHNNKYDYSKVDYKNNYTKVIIICHTHGEFVQTPDNHLQKHNCPTCAGNIKLTKEIFSERANIIYDNKYDYSKVNYKSIGTKITIICPIHGEFQQIPSDHLNNHGCSKCSGYAKITYESFIEKANIIHYNKYDYSKVNYKDIKAKIIIICPTHGEFIQTPDRHLRKGGCLKCGGSEKLTAEIFIKRSNIIHNSTYDYSKVNYINNHTKVTIICPKHGEFLQVPSSHLSKHGCPQCQNTYKETEWIKSFNNSNILTNQIIKIDNKQYRPDGFDPITNTIYEFNGDFWHGNPIKYKSDKINKKNKKTFGELHQATLQKEKELKEAGYNVISIWERDFDKLNRQKCKI